MSGSIGSRIRTGDAPKPRETYNSTRNEAAVRRYVAHSEGTGEEMGEYSQVKRMRHKTTTDPGST